MQSNKEGNYNIKGIVDLPQKKGNKILGYKIIASDNEISELSKEYKSFFITIGELESPHNRIKLFEFLKKLNLSLLPIIASPNTYISKHSKIQEGTIIMYQTMVNAGAIIGKNCIINNKALIEHDAYLGDHCHISIGAIINGGG